MCFAQFECGECLTLFVAVNIGKAMFLRSLRLALHDSVHFQRLHAAPEQPTCYAINAILWCRVEFEQQFSHIWWVFSLGADKSIEFVVFHWISLSGEITYCIMVMWRVKYYFTVMSSNCILSEKCTFKFFFFMLHINVLSLCSFVPLDK